MACRSFQFIAVLFLATSFWMSFVVSEPEEESNEKAIEKVADKVKENQFLQHFEDPFFEDLPAHVMEDLLKEAEQMEDPTQFYKRRKYTPTPFTMELIFFPTGECFGAIPQNAHPGIIVDNYDRFDWETQTMQNWVTAIFCSGEKRHRNDNSTLILELSKNTFCRVKHPKNIINMGVDSRRIFRTRIPDFNYELKDSDVTDIKLRLYNKYQDLCTRRNITDD